MFIANYTHTHTHTHTHYIFYIHITYNTPTHPPEGAGSRTAWLAPHQIMKKKKCAGRSWEQRLAWSTAHQSWAKRSTPCSRTPTRMASKLWGFYYIECVLYTWNVFSITYAKSTTPCSRTPTRMASKLSGFYYIECVLYTSNVFSITYINEDGVSSCQVFHRENVFSICRMCSSIECKCSLYVECVLYT